MLLQLYDACHHTPYSLYTSSPVSIITSASIRYRCTPKTREFRTRLLYRIAILWFQTIQLGNGLGLLLKQALSCYLKLCCTHTILLYYYLCLLSVTLSTNKCWYRYGTKKQLISEYNERNTKFS